MDGQFCSAQRPPFNMQYNELDQNVINDKFTANLAQSSTAF